MKITGKDVLYAAGLSNLNLTEDEIARFALDLDGIVTYMGKLNEIDTTGVEPMTQVLFDADETATLREDEERTPLDNATALASAAIAGGGYFKVPKVIER